MESKRLPPPSPRGGLPPRLERPGVTSPLTSPLPSPRPAPLVPPPQPPPMTQLLQTEYNESTWLRDDEFICEAYYANQPKSRKTSHTTSTRPVQNALLHKQCVETIAQCTQSLHERRQKMAELSLPFTPLRKKPVTLAPSRDRFASPNPATRLFDSTISPILPENSSPQPTPEPSCDVRKRLSFLDDSMNEDKSAHSVSTATVDSDLSMQTTQASEASPGDIAGAGTMV